MKIQATLCALATLASVASATIVLAAGTTVLTVGGGTVAVLLGAKLLALKGVLIGRALGKRSSETLEEIFLEASRKDQYDCAKLLICELSATPAQQLRVIKLCFNPNPSSIYSCSLSHILEHEFFCLGRLGSPGSKGKKWI